MEKWRFNFKRFAIAQAILIPIITFPIWYLKLFPPPTEFCLDFRNGEAVKLYDSDCQQSDRLNIASAVVKTLFPMPKIPDCEVCLMCAHDPSLVCAVHPYGQDSDFCPDFRPDPDLESIRFQDFLGLQRQQSENSDEPFSNPFSQNPDEEQWEPEGASYYNGELILQPKQKTREEQLWLLDNHPLFTGVCPACKYPFPQANFHIIHFDCPNCGWVDDSV